MPDPTPTPNYPDPFAGMNPGEGYGRMNPGGAGGPPRSPAGAVPGGDANGAFSPYQASWGAARATPADGSAATSAQAGATGVGTPYDPNAAAPAAPPAPDPAADYARLFGTVTPQTRMARGLPPTGPTTPPVGAPGAKFPVPPVGSRGYVPPNGGGADNAPVGPKSTPEQAGDNNSMMPGWNGGGHGVVGTPKADQGVADKGVSTTAAVQPPAPRPKYPPMSPPGQAPSTPVGAAAALGTDVQKTTTADGAAAAQMAAPLTAAGGETATMTRDAAAPAATLQPTAASGETASTTREAAGPGGHPPTAAATSAPAQSNEPAAPGGAPNVPTKSATASQDGATPTAKPYSVGGIDYTLPTGTKLPQAWPTMTPTSRQAWMAKNGTPVDQAQADATNAVNSYKQFTGLQFPGTNPVPGGKATLAPGASQKDIAAATGGDPTLMRLVTAAQTLYPSFAGGTDTGGSSTTPGQTSKNSQEYLAITKALGAYGITIAPPTTGGGTTTGDETNGGTTTGDGTTHTGVDTNSGGASGGVQNGNAGTSLDLANSDPNYQALLAKLIPAWGDKAPAMVEAIIAQAKSQDEAANRQNAVNIDSSAARSFDTNPLYTGSQDLAGKILANPDPIDWGAIRNQLVTKENAQGADAIKALGASTARRLGSSGMGASAGMAGDIQRAANSDSADKLGQLDVQRGQVDRQMQDDALKSGLSTLAGTSGVDISNWGNVANMVAGQPSNYANPYSGIAAAFTNIDATQQAIDASKASGQLSWADVFKALFNSGSGGSGSSLGGAALTAGAGALVGLI